jgi:hypothetical protein
VRRALLVVLLAWPFTAAARPLLVAGIGGGFDFEPRRTFPDRTIESATLGSFAFEGEVMGDRFGLLVRGVGTDGSDDYMATGFDRFGVSVAATFRPLSYFRFAAGPGYGAQVARRFALEAGVMYQRILASFNTADNFGIHLGVHDDFPLGGTDASGRGVFLRLTLQRPIIILDDTISNGIESLPIHASGPIVQTLAALAVGF